jgi:preprotein translocase subunit SecY
MLTAFLRAFRTPDLRRKLLFTLFIIGVFRLGSTLPTPGISVKAVNRCINAATTSGSTANVYQLVNLFSGGALLRLTVFALGIMPYITASIIMQLLAVVIPRLETLQDEGQAGTAVIMWLGELITDRGVGNGMSLMIFTQVIAVFPTELASVYQNKGTFALIVVILVGVAIIGFIAFMEQAQRRIPVQYAKRMVGRRMYGGTSTYIPMKVNQAGVIPVIFASSLLYIPQLAASLFGNSLHPQGWVAWIDKYFVSPQGGGQNATLYILVFFLLIVFFTYFYVAITFNPEKVADNMKKYGGFIPGIRPGRPTAEYLQYVLSRITAPGALYLGFVALVPLVAFTLVGAGNTIPFGGTPILIAVGVGLDTVKQIESQLQQRNYEGFLR